MSAGGVDLPDRIEFGGVRPLRGRLRIPGDKSISHRALIFAALTDGPSVITSLATGADVRATARVLQQLGVDVQFDGEVVVVGGRGVAGLTEADDVLDCENSGTTMRVLSGVLAGRSFVSMLTGDASLRSRPMGRVVEPLRAMGAQVDGRDDATRAPLVIRGGALHGLRYELPVASAQVKSAILLAGLQAEGATEVVSPAPSRDHTERMLAALGAPVVVDGLSIRVTRGAPDSFELDVPGDPSSAAFFAVAAAITPGSDLVLESVSCNPTRVGFVTVMKRMGADIELTPTGEVCGEPVGELRVRASELHGTTIAGEEIPNVIDEIPALAIAAAFADGVTDVRDAAELVVKESNRIGTLEEELGKLGVGVEGRRDGLVVRGGKAVAGAFDSHGDHRIAMAMAVAANALGSDSMVSGWRAVASSYPEFASDLALDRIGRLVTVVVAIDGPSGSGKSTVARGVAVALGLPVLDTGAMYRAVTLAALEAKVTLDDADAVTEIAGECTITVEDGVTMLDGQDVSGEIRGPLVTGAVSIVSAHPGVRAILVAYQRAWVVRHGGGVVEGRDIGTVVFPDATVKVFLVASDDERARRRHGDEMAAARAVAVEEVKAALDRRDAIDSGRAISPLRAADDAIVIDTTHIDVDTVVADIVNRVRTAEAP